MNSQTAIYLTPEVKDILTTHVTKTGVPLRLIVANEAPQNSYDDYEQDLEFARSVMEAAKFAGNVALEKLQELRSYIDIAEQIVVEYLEISEDVQFHLDDDRLEAADKVAGEAQDWMLNGVGRLSWSQSIWETLDAVEELKRNSDGCDQGRDLAETVTAPDVVATDCQDASCGCQPWEL